MSKCTIQGLYRYPVKGLSGASLQTTNLTEKETIPWDRAFAIENGPSGFDPASPTHLPKMKFLMLMRNEGLACLNTAFDDETQILTISENGVKYLEASLSTLEGRAEIESFLSNRFEDELRGDLKLLHVPGHSFSDVGEKVLHLINLNTVRDLEQTFGWQIDPLRFRANIYIDHLPAWQEFDWIGRSLSNGDATLLATKRTERCAATNVDPKSGARDLTLPRKLLQTFDHTDCGIYLKVTGAGSLAVTDTLSLV
ncbi:MAG: MOSC N-terminal beta barrel domain-containing protein [Stappiaceae bacterium]